MRRLWSCGIIAAAGRAVEFSGRFLAQEPAFVAISAIKGGDKLPLCQICGKGPTFGHNVSHSKRRTPRRWLPNIQKTKIMLNNESVSVRICTRCLRTLQKSQ